MRNGSKRMNEWKINIRKTDLQPSFTSVLFITRPSEGREGRGPSIASGTHSIVLGLFSKRSNPKFTNIHEVN